MIIFSLYEWLSFFIVVILMIILDLKSDSSTNYRTATIMGLIFVTSSIAFGFFIGFIHEAHYTTDFITAYLTELSLSVDNVFVFMLIFNRFDIDIKMQHKILFYGILGAIIMRIIMIIVGIKILSTFAWVMYLFAFILIYGGIKLFLSSQEKEYNKENSLVKYIEKIIAIDHIVKDKFIVQNNGKTMITINLLVLILIEKTDLIFAIDSIPAVLAITQEPFIVVTSNILAIVGLRSFYFILSRVLSRFFYMKKGLALILTFIGCKMLLYTQGIHIASGQSLIAITIIIALSILFSFFRKKNVEK